ncbi:MAG TPA: hypothetical protein VGE97_10245 [Nitrososphaera sp.]|jgi:hypothetical protein
MSYNVNNKQEHTYPHVCGQCELGFMTEEEYCNHTCDKTGFTPAEPEHLGEEFALISASAQKRGEIRQQLEEDGVDPKKAQKQAHEAVAKMKPEDILEPSE